MRSLLWTLGIAGLMLFALADVASACLNGRAWMMPVHLVLYTLALRWAFGRLHAAVEAGVRGGVSSKTYTKGVVQ